MTASHTRTSVNFMKRTVETRSACRWPREEFVVSLNSFLIVFVHRPRWFMYLSVFNSYLIIFELSKSDVFRTICLLFFFSFIVFVVGGFFPRGV